MSDADEEVYEEQSDANTDDEEEETGGTDEGPVIGLAEEDELEGGEDVFPEAKAGDAEGIHDDAGGARRRRQKKRRSVKFEEPFASRVDEEEPLSERGAMLEAQLGAWGHSMVMFSSIGIGLYFTANFMNVDFPRFLGMVMLGGLGLLASRPRYNPGFSSVIEHDLSEAEMETIRTFCQRRVDLQGADIDHRDEFLGKLKRSSYSAVSLGGGPPGAGRRRDPDYDYYYDDEGDDDGGQFDDLNDPFLRQPAGQGQASSSSNYYADPDYDFGDEGVFF